MTMTWFSDEQTRPGTILVVDDDPHVLAMLNDVLSFEGYAVEMASDGLEAMMRLRQRGKSRGVDVVVTDVMMPRLDGLTLAQWIRRERPDLPVILLSAVDGIRDGPFPFLGKPFDLDDLLALIEDVRDGPNYSPQPRSFVGVGGQAAR